MTRRKNVRDGFEEITHSEVLLHRKLASSSLVPSKQKQRTGFWGKGEPSPLMHFLWQQFTQQLVCQMHT